MRFKRSILCAATGVALLLTTGCASTWSSDRPSVLREYEGLSPQKAMAVAVDPDGRYAWGQGNSFSNVDKAIDRALEECERGRADHNIGAPCELYMVNGERQETSAP